MPKTLLPYRLFMMRVLQVVSAVPWCQQMTQPREQAGNSDTQPSSAPLAAAAAARAAAPRHCTVAAASLGPIPDSSCTAAEEAEPGEAAPGPPPMSRQPAGPATPPEVASNYRGAAAPEPAPCEAAAATSDTQHNSTAAAAATNTASGGASCGTATLAGDAQPNSTAALAATDTDTAAAADTDTDTAADAAAAAGANAALDGAHDPAPQLPPAWPSVQAFTDSLDQQTKQILAIMGREYKQHGGTRPQGVSTLEQLNSKATQCYQQGQLVQALCLFIDSAFVACKNAGPTHEYTLGAVCFVTRILCEHGKPQPPLYAWLLPRLIERCGADDAVTQTIMLEASHALCNMEDIRNDCGLFALLAAPGTAMGDAEPLQADFDTFARHVALQTRAHHIVERHTPVDAATLKLAQKMIERCHTYYGSLGGHWLACARKSQCASLLGGCLIWLRSYDEAEALLLKVSLNATRVKARVTSLTCSLDVCVCTYACTHA